MKTSKTRLMRLIRSLESTKAELKEAKKDVDPYNYFFLIGYNEALSDVEKVIREEVV